MVAQFANTSNDFTPQLLLGLKLIPADWALTPVLGNKNPYRTDWHKETPISRQQLAGLISSGDTVISKDGKQRKCYPQGYGLRTGKWSKGILAVDADGTAAHEKLNQLGGLPTTVSFTSGKPGRCQYLVRVPQEYWSVIETKKINTGVKGDDGKDQLLELRWNGCQSVLPPSVHPETGSYKWVNSPQDCEIAFCPTWIIEYFLNESTPTTATLLADDIPLYQCLTKDDRDLIDHGVGEGSRDDNGAKLARNLIGTAARLNHLGYRFEGDARQLFDDYCARCSPPLSARDADRIWKSAEKSNPSATLTDDALNNCIKAWQRHQNINIKPQQTTQAIAGTTQNAIASSTPNDTANKPDNVVLHPTVNIPYDALKAEYIQLLESGTSKSGLSRYKTEVNKKYYPLRLDRFLKDVETEYRTAEEDEIIKEDIQQLLDCANLELDIRKFLPTKLATALMLFGINQSLPQTSLMMSLISVISATHLIGTQVLIGNKHNEFYQNPAINHALVGDSGSGKSIIFRSLVKKPLNALRKAEKKRFAEQSQQYERSLAAWQQSDQSTPQPEPPPPINKMYLTGATLEGLKDYIAKAPDYSILNVVDELSGLFKGFNQYKQGQGNDRQEFLSLYDGDGFSEAKVSKNIFVEKSNTAWLGGLQPTILDKYFQLGASDGLLPRFTFSILPETIRLLPEENAQSIDVTGIVKGLYKTILDCQPQTYHITGEAYKYFREVDTKWQYEAARLPNGALKEFLKKCKGLLGRLSLNLHLIHELSDPYCGTPPTVIPLNRVKQAADIVEHLLQQIQAVHLQIAGETTQSAILAMITLSMKRQSLGEQGWLNAREISRNQTAKGRMKTAEIRELMIKAKDMGYGQLRGSGTKLEFRSKKNVGDLLAKAKNTHKPDISVVLNPDPQKMSADVGEMSAIIKNPEGIENTGLESIELKNVGNVGDFSEIFEVLDESELIVSDKNVGDINLLVNPSVVNPNVVNPSVVNPVVNPDENLSIISPTTPTTPTKLESLAETIANTNVESADILPTNLPTDADNRRQNSAIPPSTTDDNSISDLPPTTTDNRRQNSSLLPTTTTDDNCPQNEEQELSTEEPQPTTDEPQQVVTEKDAVRNVWANAALIRECIADQSWEMIDSFLEEWTDEFKAAVWAELTPTERKAVKQLKPKA
ncbi:hypothetical protein CLI64_29515 (plasmid) [Nostoc sp. CENA543]|uniref:DUF3987 domain-containing protein n=1 Tax=Nostoc sp. CENA543 TaxID=1869241 RepID=UPI000CA1B2E7|nr:DUF3987 domain-containing protein [Nostoc sp. CENA543]AUT04581.1 hypothetical protein CLI64_29515 [Nostoc sp. CENA543]